MDVLLAARDSKLYRSITDCGAGGFSSAVGELGAEIGAEVHLERVPLKHAGMAPWEIWLSESQERMVLAVPPKAWPALRNMFADEDVEAVELGIFKDTGRLQVFSSGERVADLPMPFLHDGLPRVEQRAQWQAPRAGPRRRPASDEDEAPQNLGPVLLEKLSDPNTCSREWLIRQYDHTVQGQTIGRPLHGKHDGPGDAAVIWPFVVTGQKEVPAVAIAMGLSVGPADPHAGAVSAIDEALRNLACVGADTRKAALLDNFCWGDPRNPSDLGSLVRAAAGCRDGALAFEVPFISGKDSLNNTFVDEKGARVSIPGTLLISAIAPLPEPQSRITMDLKAPDHVLCLLAPRRGGLEESRLVLDLLQTQMRAGAILACHDISEGGLLVAAAEMAFAGGVGLELVTTEIPGETSTEKLFGEGLTRFLVELDLEAEKKLQRAFKDHLCRRVGVTTKGELLMVKDRHGRSLVQESLATLRDGWRDTLAALLDGKRRNRGSAASQATLEARS
jgi:phosphoribosylformylglycinamidine synthase